MLRPDQTSRRDLIAIASASLLPAPHAGATPADRSGRMLEAGVHAIDADLTITEDVMFGAGALFHIAAGATLTLTGDMIAPARHIFEGRGRVDLSRSRLLAARPEWWGAIPDDAAVDCAPAIEACMAAHPATQLGLGDYHLHAALTVQRSNTRIWGIGRTNNFRGTRLLRSGGEGPVVLVGTEKAPRQINDFLRGIDMRWIELGRTRSPATPASGDPPAGLCIRHVLDCVFEGLRAHEHAVGYSVRGAVRTYLQDCTAFRSTSSETPATDIFIGFDLSGSAAAGTTGANASLFLVDCNARTGGNPPLARSVGLLMAGEIADSFVTRFETTSLADGIVIDGQADRLAAARQRAGHVDVNIQAPVLDQCSHAGITVANLSDYALLDIRDAYVALAPGNGTAIRIERCGGNIGVAGGQLIGWVAAAAGGDATGIALTDVAGVAIDGAKLLGFPRPIEARRARGFEIVVAINDPDRSSRAPAVRLVDCCTGYVRPRISGRERAYAGAIEIEGDARSLSIETAGIDPAAIAASAAVVAAGRPIAPGTKGPVSVTGPSL